MERSENASMSIGHSKQTLKPGDCTKCYPLKLLLHSNTLEILEFLLNDLVFQYCGVYSMI